VISRRTVLAGAALVLGPSGPVLARGGARNPRIARAIPIEADPFSSFSAWDRRVFGKLTFLGGLELRSKDPEFGGISSGQIDPDGRGFLAMSDRAHWIAGRFVEKDGVLTGIEAATIAPALAPDGRRMKDTRYFDTEGMARKGNSVFISVERTHDIVQFDFSSEGFAARGRLIEVPSEMKGLDANRGVEALGILPQESPYAGSLIALAERAPTAAASPNNPGWIIGPRSGRLSVRKIGAFDITDVNFLPCGDMLVLERRFTPPFGVGFRLRRIPIGVVKPGAELDGEVLIEADMSHQIDNMEVLMVHRAADGRAILTLLSDDNFSFVQRTLVLRFALGA
jgi:hypothetical protein